MISFTNKVLKVQNKWLFPVASPTKYNVYTSGVNGSVSATPDYGPTGTEVTLSNTPDTGYTFDSYTIVGATLKNASQFDIGSQDVYVSGVFAEYDPYNPLGLPPNTVRVRTSDGNVPTKSSSTTYETATLVAGTTNVYDVYKSGTNFKSLLYSSRNVVEVLGANTTGITNMVRMFFNCTSLRTVPLFDTSNVWDMASIFMNCTALTSVPLFNTSNVQGMVQILYGCTSITTIPLFDTSKVTSMNQAFYGCTNVQSGALALYQQASTQTTPPSNHSSTFKNCGSNTTAGAAELAQIPSSWGGTGA